jgi:hypothetical protein
MGKDSELASTLAQGKPVIAYVPRYRWEDYAGKIRDYPLSFFKKRLLVLLAEGLFDDAEVRRKLEGVNAGYAELVDGFLEKLTVYRREQPFSLWRDRDADFKKANAEEFAEICRVLAVAECQNFERRAALFSGRHPLAMQVNLDTGVANGVMVARTPGQCAEVLWRLLTNRLEFVIRHDAAGFTVLEESKTRSAFRVVTDDVKLSNSFWNLYSSDEELN